MSLLPSTGLYVQQTNHLPLEILREVFLTYQDTFSIVEECHPRRAPPRTFVSVSHVSRQWRQAAISCQRLWSTALPCGSVEWTKLCLSRCFSAPFYFAVNGLDLCDREEYRSAFNLTLPHLARVRKLQYVFEVDHHSKDVTHASNAARELLSMLSTTSLPYMQDFAIFYSVENAPLETSTRLDYAKTMPALVDLFMRGIVYVPSPGQHCLPCQSPHTRSP